MPEDCAALQAQLAKKAAELEDLQGGNPALEDYLAREESMFDAKASLDGENDKRNAFYDYQAYQKAERQSRDAYNRAESKQNAFWSQDRRLQDLYREQAAADAARAAATDPADQAAADARAQRADSQVAAAEQEWRHRADEAEAAERDSSVADQAAETAEAAWKKSSFSANEMENFSRSQSIDKIDTLQRRLDRLNDQMANDRKGAALAGLNARLQHEYRELVKKVEAHCHQSEPEDDLDDDEDDE